MDEETPRKTHIELVEINVAPGQPKCVLAAPLQEQIGGDRQTLNVHNVMFIIKLAQDLEIELVELYTPAVCTDNDSFDVEAMLAQLLELIMVPTTYVDSISHAPSSNATQLLGEVLRLLSKVLQ